MVYLDTDIIAEVRQNREKLLERHGGLVGLHKHMQAARPWLEKQGWQFVSHATVRAKQEGNKTAQATH